MKLLDAFSLQKNSTNGDIKIPNYDREIIKQNTKNNPEWIHFGAGNIFRSFIAADVDKMIEMGFNEVPILEVDNTKMNYTEAIKKSILL